MTHLAPNTLKILALLIEARNNHTRPPSYRELQKATGIRSLNGVFYHMALLRDLGLIEWEYNRARTARALCRFVPAEDL